MSWPELNVLFPCQKTICQIQHSLDGGKTVEHSHLTENSPPNIQVWSRRKHADKSAYLAAVFPTSENHKSRSSRYWVLNVEFSALSPFGVVS